MFRKYRLEIIAVVTVLVFCGLFIYSSSLMDQAVFAGSDTAGSAKVAEITGTPEEEFTPLVGQWAPPSGEVESGLFALQAAIGGIIVGWVFGYWKGQKRAATRNT